MGLLEKVRAEAARRNLSRHTAEAYVRWVRRFVIHHERQHPMDLGTDEVRAFLVSLAREEGLSASSRNQALCALRFLYGAVLGQVLPPAHRAPPQRLGLVRRRVLLQELALERLNQQAGASPSERQQVVAERQALHRALLPRHQHSVASAHQPLRTPDLLAALAAESARPRLEMDLVPSLSEGVRNQVVVAVAEAVDVVGGEVVAEVAGVNDS